MRALSKSYFSSFYVRQIVTPLLDCAFALGGNMESKRSPYFRDVNVTESSTVRRTRSKIKSGNESHKAKLDIVSHESSVEKNVVKTEVDEEATTVGLWTPQNWETVLDNIRTMRMVRDAPVDVCGAEKCAASALPPEVKRFHVLVSLMLSSQTRDQVTFDAVERLKKHGLSVDSMISIEEEALATLIYPVGFWKKKASYIKRTAEKLKHEYQGDIPRTVEELCKLPGVGQKMAVLAVNIGWGTTVGIGIGTSLWQSAMHYVFVNVGSLPVFEGVDTHVHRIANRLGWTRKPTKTPEATQKELEDWMPRPLWEEVNILLVGFGQQNCTPVKPKCGTCLNREICPVGKSWSAVGRKK